MNTPPNDQPLTHPGAVTAAVTWVARGINPRPIRADDPELGHLLEPVARALQDQITNPVIQALLDNETIFAECLRVAVGQDPERQEREGGGTWQEMPGSTAGGQS